MTTDQIIAAIRAKKLLTEEQIAKLKREANLSDKSAEQVIHEENLISPEKLAEAKSEILKVPYAKVDIGALDQKILALIPEETVRAYQVVPLYVQDNSLVVGMVNPDDVKAQEALKFVISRGRLSLGALLISYADWQQVLRRYSPYRSEVQEAVQSLGSKVGTGASALRTVELEESTSTSRSEEAPVIRIVASTLKEAVLARASDIHIEPQERELRIRFRIDGDLKEVSAMPVSLAPLVVARVKILASLKTDETRVPQDGRFRSKIFDREIDFRVATFPLPFGEKIVLRILDPSAGLANMDKLGLNGRNKEIVLAGLKEPYGMILVTGPTGSGKSTSLYALLQSLNDETVNIVSLEDPVEYFIAGVNQSQVRSEIGYDFASGLRQILRQDPDVIMVGEIRDRETASLAVNAALTGHVVLSTLHTNNSSGVIPRLIDMGVEPFLLPSALNLMIAQRLVARVCPDCRVAVPAAPPIAQLIEKALAGLPEAKTYPAPYQVFHGKGCDKCKGKGTLGRIAVFEVMPMTPELEAIVNTKAPTSQQLLASAKTSGMVTMRQDGVLKALAGETTIEEVIRETEDL